MSKLGNLLIFGIPFLFTLLGCKESESEIQHDLEEVIMRKIGHEILLSSNDSISIVRPIIHEGNKYRIQFESSFSFLPDDLVKTIDTIIKTRLSYNNYLVQVEECENNLVVYSYEYDYDIDQSPFPEILVACREREQPKACYEIVIQFITKEEKTSSLWLYYLLVILLLSVGIYIYVKKNRSRNNDKIK